MTTKRLHIWKDRNHPKGMLGKHQTKESNEKNRLAHLGKEPWNKGKKMKSPTEEHRKKISISNKGKHNSLKTEFKNYSSGKIKYKNKKPISNILWCKANNIHRIPKRCVVHHIDGNRENNNIGNLQLMTKGFHAKLHQILVK